jgi:hypothetical protein
MTARLLMGCLSLVAQIAAVVGNPKSPVRVRVKSYLTQSTILVFEEALVKRANQPPCWMTAYG